MVSSIEQTSHKYLDEVTDDTDDEELLTEEDETNGEEYAILAWLQTFSQISQNKLVFSKDWSHDKIISRALLSVAAEICDTHDIALDGADASQHWETMAEWVGKDSKKYLHKESRLFILICLLCHAVANECNKRGAYISRIMNLDKGVQRALMQIIETGAKEVNDEKDFNRNTYETHNKADDTYLDDLDIENDNESLLDDDEKDFYQPNTNKENIENRPAKMDPRFLSPLNTIRQSCIKSKNSTPRFLGSSSSTPRRSMFTPLSPHNLNIMKMEKLEKETEDLQSQNNILSKELDAMRKQEQTFATKLSKIEAEHRADRLGVEASALMRVNDLNDEYTENMSKLEKELCVCRDSVVDATSTKEEVVILRDEVDVLRHSNGKLIQAEEHLTRLKLKMEQMGEVAEALRREEKAHSDSVSKCLILENELAILQPIRRQLDEYKSRTADAEVKVIEYEEDIQNLKIGSKKLGLLNKNLQDRSIRQQTETEELRRQIEQDEPHILQKEGNALGEGMSELNPVLKEELLRLRCENKRLRTFAAKRNEDSFQKMEVHVEDSDRLATKFKEQYFSTKSSLREIKEKLEENLQREIIQKQKVSDSEESVKMLKQTLKEERYSHQKALLDALRAQQSMKRSIIDKCREEKNSLDKEWENKLVEQNQVTEKEKIRLRQESEQKEEKLAESIAELREERSSVLLKHQKKLWATIDGLEVDHKAKIVEISKKYSQERDKLIKEGKDMVEKEKSNAHAKVKESQKDCDELVMKMSQELQKCQQMYKVNGEKARNKINSYRQRNKINQAKESQMLRESDSLRDKYKKLDKEKARLHDENERYRRQLGGRFGSDSNSRIQYEELQQEYNTILEENRSLKKHANTKITCMHADVESVQTNSQDFLAVETSISYDRGISGGNSSITQLRAEYEERIEEIVDEKRELIMKNSAARTDVQKVEIRAHDLEAQVQQLENEKTNLQLQLGRARLHHDPFSPVASGKRLASKVSPSAIACRAHEMWKSSKISKVTSPPLVVEPGKKDESLDDSAISSPSNISTIPRVEIASPIFTRSMNNFKEKLHHSLSTKKEKKPRAKRLSVTKPSPKRAHKSLIEHTSSNGSEVEDSNPECTQS